MLACVLSSAASDSLRNFRVKEEDIKKLSRLMSFTRSILRPSIMACINVPPFAGINFVSGSAIPETHSV